jgi:hypothetical protein
MALPEAVRLFVEPLERLELPYAVTGSVAASVYGDPRMTRDVDFVLLLKLAQVETYHAAFPGEQFYVPPVEVLAIEIARPQRGSFNLIHHATGFKADVYLANRDPLHTWALAQRRRIQFEGCTMWVAPPEYVILRKLEFFRESGQEKHHRDVEFIVRCTHLDTSFLDLEIQQRGLIEVWEQCRGGAGT